MHLFNLIALLITFAAVASYVNHRWLKLPTTIGLMLIALVFSLGLIGVGYFLPSLEERAESIVESTRFNETLMEGMLGLLLFAGALHINLSNLADQKWVIGLLATVGVILSTLIVGTLAWAVFRFTGLAEVRYIYCLVFGALIAPTDPIAVLGVLKHIGAPKELEIQIAGESLFNDGIGVVVFLGLVEMATGEHGFDVPHLFALFMQEAVGGAIFGLVIGYLAYLMLQSVENYQVEILLSLAVAAGGYALANALHLSGPIAMVVAGLLIGNHGRLLAMSDKTAEHLDLFWELVDEILNAVLFALIGLEILVLTDHVEYVWRGLLLIPVVLLARAVSVAVPVTILKTRRRFASYTIPVLTWAGLKGGISVALALGLKETNVDGEFVSERPILITVTYVIVVFSILVQGLTVGPYVRRQIAHEAKSGKPRSDPAASHHG